MWSICILYVYATFQTWTKFIMVYNWIDYFFLFNYWNSLPKLFSQALLKHCPVISTYLFQKDHFNGTFLSQVKGTRKLFSCRTYLPYISIHRGSQWLYCSKKKAKGRANNGQFSLTQQIKPVYFQSTAFFLGGKASLSHCTNSSKPQADFVPKAVISSSSSLAFRLITKHPDHTSGVMLYLDRFKIFFFEKWLPFCMPFYV